MQTPSQLRTLIALTLFCLLALTSSAALGQQGVPLLPLTSTQTSGLLPESAVGDRALLHIDAVATSRATVGAALNLSSEAMAESIQKARLQASKRSARETIKAAITRASVANAALNIHKTLRKASLDAGKAVAKDGLQQTLAAALSRASSGVTDREIVQIRQFEVEIWWGQQWVRDDAAPRIPAGYRVFRPGEKRPPVGKVAELIAQRRKPIHTYTPFRINDKRYLAFDELHTATIRDGRRVSGEFRGVSVFVKSTSPELYGVNMSARGARPNNS